MLTSTVTKAPLTAAMGAAIATLGILTAPAAQAAIISGQVSGTWNSYVEGGFFNISDAFTADYTYDSNSITTYDSSNANYSRYLYSVAPLLSLVFKSGAITDVFPLDIGSIEWYDVQANPDTGSSYALKQINITAEYYDALEGRFFSVASTGQNPDGSPFSSSFARVSQIDGSSIETLYFGEAYSGVSIADTTAVPTPALLPGLIGMGVAALRKRKGEALAEASEQA
ncbi:MAG: hypothetical protein DCF32_04195 [Leptolyngbya sp.]|nr:MAG: hypothetical protein DCF32_04195 [Leptolyngbya sp.]